MLKDSVAIVGIGETAFQRRSDLSELELACEAITRALEDAGLDHSEVDALSCFTQESTPEFEIARNLGFGPVHFMSQTAHGGGASCGALGHLALAIAGGVANVGVLWRSRKRGDPSRRQWAGVTPRIGDHWRWSRPQGLVRPVDEIAMLARRYMYEHNIGRDELAHVALAQRRYANENPRALMKDRKLTLRDYRDARMISDPLCLYDNCLESDGAIALVVVRADRTHSTNTSVPVLVHAFSQGLSPQHQLMTDYHGDNPLCSPSYVTAANLWRQADYTPDEINVAQIYDAFSPLVLFGLEAYGFCDTGTAARFVAEGGTAIDGKLPVNTSGGSLSEVYLHGMNLLTEAVRQLRGEACNQVKGARLCLVSTCDSTPNGALLLKRGDRE